MHRGATDARVPDRAGPGTLKRARNAFLGPVQDGVTRHDGPPTRSRLGALTHDMQRSARCGRPGVRTDGGRAVGMSQSTGRGWWRAPCQQGASEALRFLDTQFSPTPAVLRHRSHDENRHDRQHHGDSEPSHRPALGHRPYGTRFACDISSLGRLHGVSPSHIFSADPPSMLVSSRDRSQGQVAGSRQDFPLMGRARQFRRRALQRSVATLAMSSRRRC